MRFLSISALLALDSLRAAATPTRPDIAPRATPTVYLCGDSTMAKGGANDGDTDGWGQYFGTYSTVTVVNKAIGGRSARSFWEEGRFAEVADLTQSGDIVVIEFGHNDGGSPESNDNGRSDCPGDGEETCVSDVTGETVYTFVFYVVQAAKLMIAKGATVVLSSQTPNNAWETGTFVGTPSRFVGYQVTAQKAIGANAYFVDHFQAVSDMYFELGDAATNALYPNDHTHTSPEGANLSAQALTQAIYTRMNGTTSLYNYIISDPPVVY
ncbi:carbohydrate esterase family 12 protein [Xylaria sp. CBS 124048]|nr:carbohydrate esterase family 12 protein [Xylaria sp. CBS 124048]